MFNFVFSPVASTQTPLPHWAGLYVITEKLSVVAKLSHTKPPMGIDADSDVPVRS